MQQIINQPLSLFYFFTFKLGSTTAYTLLSLSKYIVCICLQDTNTNTYMMNNDTAFSQDSQTFLSSFHTDLHWPHPTHYLVDQRVHH